MAAEGEGFVVEMVIQGYQPEGLFRYFEEICAIPHGSFHEERLADYLEAFAHAHGFACKRDSLHNVVIQKPGSAGCEALPALMLQAHTDMVCVQSPGYQVNFEQDGLQLYIEDGLLRAKGTTLGADDGVGVALILQALSDKSLRHPPLECLFTAQEEVGMGGVRVIDLSGLTARALINLDSGDEQFVTTGCAGGMRLALSKTLTLAPCGRGAGLAVTIEGLRSGHSGREIHHALGNSIKLMARILHHLGAEHPFRLAALQGGGKSNAIPRESSALLVFETEAAAQAALELVKEQEAVLRAEYGALEPALAVQATLAPVPANAAVVADTEAAVRFLYLAPNGVRMCNPLMGDAVVASSNLATVHLQENGTLQVQVMARSAVDSIQEETRGELALLSELFGFALTVENQYAGWPSVEHSPLRACYLACAEQVFGKRPVAEMRHVGLECAMLTARMPGLDAISIGPNMQNGHTPEECLDLASMERFWRALRLLLETIWRDDSSSSCKQKLL